MISKGKTGLWVPAAKLWDVSNNMYILSKDCVIVYPQEDSNLIRLHFKG